MARCVQPLPPFVSSDRASLQALVDAERVRRFEIAGTEIRLHLAPKTAGSLTFRITAERQAAVTLPAAQYWQDILPRGTLAGSDAGGYRDTYPARLPDGREIAFPIRVLPGDGDRAVASLILNQASFAVEDALADVLADRARALAPEIVVAVPTLGLGLGNAVARRLGHPRLVALGTSRKFWYEDALSVPVTSITSPTIPRVRP